jgi:hypothetical protein
MCSNLSSCYVGAGSFTPWAGCTKPATVVSNLKLSSLSAIFTLAQYLLGSIELTCLLCIRGLYYKTFYDSNNRCGLNNIASLRSFPSYFQKKIGTLPTISTKITYNRPYRQQRLAMLTYNIRYITS